MSINTSHHQAGFSTLLFVLVMSLMLELVLFTMMLASRVNLSRSLLTSNSQESYFAAEGVLHDSLLLLRQQNWPPKVPYTQSIKVGDVNVERHVDFIADKQEYQVDVESEFKEVKRKLTAYYKPEQQAQQAVTPLDVVLVIDTSSSMSSIMAYVKTAVIQLLDSGAFGAQDRVAVIGFSSSAQVVQDFNPDIPTTKDTVRLLKVDGGTFTQDALEKTVTLLTSKSRPEAKKVVIIFTDGMPTYGRSTPTQKPFRCDETCFDPHLGNLYSPNNGGNHCTDQTIKSAQDLHASTEIAVYGVFFSHKGGVCKDPTQNPVLGRQTLQQIVGDRTHYFETSQLSELSGIFQTVGDSIIQSKQASYKYQEVPPDENPN